MLDANGSSPRLKDQYRLARCCAPNGTDKLTGYFGYDNLVKVHRHDCANLAKAESDRLVKLEWSEILDSEPFRPGNDYAALDEIDFAVLRHHRDFDIDYSHKVARVLGLAKQDAFERHSRLRELGLLERVEALMVQYRKKIARNKWIKHRNHTYYALTNRGAVYLQYHEKGRSDAK